MVTSRNRTNGVVAQLSRTLDFARHQPPERHCPVGYQRRSPDDTAATATALPWRPPVWGFVSASGTAALSTALGHLAPGYAGIVTLSDARDVEEVDRETVAFEAVMTVTTALLIVNEGGEVSSGNRKTVRRFLPRDGQNETGKPDLKDFTIAT
jgi:hypothetical protein